MFNWKIYFFIFLIFFSGKALAFEIYECKIYKTNPYLDLNQYKYPPVQIRLDFKKKKVYPFNDFELFNINFTNQQVSWSHISINPVNNLEQISFTYFDIQQKLLQINTFPNKQNLVASDLLIQVFGRCGK